VRSPVRLVSEFDYRSLHINPSRARAEWDSVVREQLVDAWMAAYAARTPWLPQIVEIEIGALIYLFDAAPTTGSAEAHDDDRVVVVWGRSEPPRAPRDRRRLAGFIPLPGSWSVRGLDRGHLVAHAAGGGLDINLVPQAAALNRGRSRAGRRWRALECEASARPGTPLFVRPIYHDASWAPAELEYGLVREDGLHVERFCNPARA
jgi:hypothetical protein